MNKKDILKEYKDKFIGDVIPNDKDTLGLNKWNKARLDFISTLIDKVESEAFKEYKAKSKIALACLLGEVGKKAYEKGKEDEFKELLRSDCKPMGVSKWKLIGKTYGYDKYFKKEAEEKYKDLGKKITDIIGEFGDNPKECFGIIDDWINGGENVEY